MSSVTRVAGSRSKAAFEASRQASKDAHSRSLARLGFSDLSTSAGVQAAKDKLMNRGSSSGDSSMRRTYTFSTPNITWNKASRGSSGGGSGDAGATKNFIINRIQSAGFGSLDARRRDLAQELLSPDEYSRYVLGKDPGGGESAAPATPAPVMPAPATGGSGTPGGTLDANALMELYQKGLGAGEAKGASTDDQIRLLREGNELDLKRKRAEQDMQMEGQKTALSQTQEARAKERETEANLQRRQQSTERSNAMAAFKGL